VDPETGRLRFKAGQALEAERCRRPRFADAAVIRLTVFNADIGNISPISRLCLGCAGRTVRREGPEINRSLLDQHLLPLQQIALGRDDRRPDPGRDHNNRVLAAIPFFRHGSSPPQSESLSDILMIIINEVIGQRKARAFLFPSNARNDAIEELFDARLLHILKKNVSSKDQPGHRYDGFKIDYGCYVDLINTNREPNGLSKPTTK
jgi:hypothetical protein